MTEPVADDPTTRWFPWADTGDPAPLTRMLEQQGWYPDESGARRPVSEGMVELLFRWHGEGEPPAPQ